jgi:hypothetical protein
MECVRAGRVCVVRASGFFLNGIEFPYFATYSLVRKVVIVLIIFVFFAFEVLLALPLHRVAKEEAKRTAQQNKSGRKNKKTKTRFLSLQLTKIPPSTSAITLQHVITSW